MKRKFTHYIAAIAALLCLSGCFTIQKSRNIKDPAVTTESWSIFPQWGKPDFLKKEAE